MIETVRDTSLAVDIDGPDSGPAIVMLHSVGLSTREGWRAQVPALVAAGWRVVRFDFRCLGQSARGARPPAIATFAEDLAALMDGLSITRAVIMGVSLGGFVAQAFALDHPDRVRALVLVSTAARIEAGNSGPRAARNRLIRERGMAAAVGPQIDSHFPAAFRAAHPEIMAWYRDHYLANDPETYAAIMEDLGGFDSRSRLRELRCPVLVVAGGADDSNVAGGIPGRAARALAGAIAGARLEIIADAHHYPQIDHAEEFNRVVLEFLGAVCPEP